jgi:hypothetical protein
VLKCPAGDHPVFVYKSGAIVPHYNGNGLPCKANLTKHPGCEKPEPPAESNAPLHSHEPDTCCGAAISKALRSGLLNTVERWECPKCGMLWTPEMHGEIKHWMPRPYFQVVRHPHLR